MAFPILINLQSQSQDTKKVHFGSLKIQTCPGVTSSVTLFTANQVFPLHPITYDTVINLASGRITREIHFSFYKWQNKEWYDTCWLSEKIWYDRSRYIIKRVSCCRFLNSTVNWVQYYPLNLTWIQKTVFLIRLSFHGTCEG